MKRLCRFLYLLPAERGILIKAVLLLWAVRLGLWVLPFRVVERLADWAGHTPAPLRGSGSSSLDRTAWAVAAASRYVPHATCLVQALAARVLLKRAGLPSSLHIGVARSNEGQLQAHAWVESQDRIVIGQSDVRRYTPLLALERSYTKEPEAQSP